MGGKIECYLDIASYYSYIAFVQLQNNERLLSENSVEIDIHPFLIGAVNVASGNSPPWKVPAKAKHSQYDIKRAADSLGLKDLKPPGPLMEVGKTLIPMRAITYIKSAFPTTVYLSAFGYLFHSFWALRKAPNTLPILKEVLSEIPSDFRVNTPTSSTKLFTPEQVSQVLEAAESQEVKDKLKGNVEEALKRGAFGAPWIWVTNEKGSEEPFFGSDRWHYVFGFLGLPYKGLELLPPQKATL
ncbi:thioredoxin-like protein [Xylariaceae sp. FL1019]|nr:thioredoxin-like protein [Xylariaceae sp. FL1019]